MVIQHVIDELNVQPLTKLIALGPGLEILPTITHKGAIDCLPIAACAGHSSNITVLEFDVFSDTGPA